ncbi:hypothetical protein LCGC14_2051430 [marine sediment metagenome]|uniref:Uncharacterized protein n=1 Tax=marine sediment metagenome TaxID=412755 RepID=A0A0F9ENY1_9ZZZZ
MATAEDRLEVFGFNLKHKTKLTQKALDARSNNNWRRLYHILHQIKKLRLS